MNDYFSNAQQTKYEANRSQHGTWDSLTINMLCSRLLNGNTRLSCLSRAADQMHEFLPWLIISYYFEWCPVSFCRSRFIGWLHVTFQASVLQVQGQKHWMKTYGQRSRHNERLSTEAADGRLWRVVGASKSYQCCWWAWRSFRDPATFTKRLLSGPQKKNVLVISEF